MPINPSDIKVQQIRKWLDYALTQVAAESYWHLALEPKEILRRGNSPVPPGGNPADQSTVTQYIRMTEAQATAFLQRYEVKHHHANDSSGFSATLLWDKVAQTYTLAFRSTEWKNPELGGDYDRDGFFGADGNVAFQGFAFGQILAMERYWQQLTSSGGPLENVAQINVVSYSLGANLASVFTELHTEKVNETVVFNAAGRGQILKSPGDQTAALRLMLFDFQTALENPAATEPDRDDPNYGKWDAAQTASYDASWLDSNHVFGAARRNLYRNPRYEWALAYVIDKYGFAMSNGVNNSAGTEKISAFRQITQLFGHANHNDIEVTANSGLHAPATSIFIEGQSYIEGNAGKLPFAPELTASRASQGDFGNTHSLTLIIDSLTLMEAFMSIDANLNKVQVESIFAAASNTRATQVAPNGVSGTAEGDSLEKALDALRRLYLGPTDYPGDTLFDDSNGGFGRAIGFRTTFHENIAILKTAAAAKGGGTLMNLVPESRFSAVNGEPVGTESLGLAAQLALSAEAADGIAYRYALKELNPFVLLDNPGLYAQHNQNGELDLFEPADGRGKLTKEYLRDRAALFERSLYFNVANEPTLQPNATGSVYNDGKYFEDRARNLVILQGTQPRDPLLARTIFGSGADEPLTGGDQADSLYGGDGADQLFGLAGVDHLEGGGGLDHLRGGAGKDELLGGKDVDSLVGGAGADTYHIGKGDGIDYIIDFAGDEFGGDGSGTIELLGIGLNGTKDPVNPGQQDGLYQDANGFRYAFTGTLVGRGILTITKPGETDGAIVLGYARGELGITFSDAPPIPKTTLSGTEGDDTLAADAAFQKVLALGGHDRIVVSTMQAEGWGGLGNDFITNDAGDQKLYGEAGRDILIASEGADELYGGDDNDALQGGADGDALDGGLGDDFLDGGLGSDVLYGGDGRDFLVGGGSLVPAISWTPSDDLPAFGAYAVAGLPTGLQAMSGFLRIDGDAADVLDGGPGEDTLFGGGGNDLVLGGDDADLLDGDDGDDTLAGGAGADHLYGDGTEGVITFTGPGGDTPVFVLPEFHGSDTLLGGAGDDLLVGDGGADQLYGGEDNDTLIGDNALLPIEYHGADTLDGGDGADTLYGDGGDDTLYGGEGDDTLQGDSSDVPDDRKGDDYLDGGNGADTLTGDGGADILYGGAGDDFLHGDAENVPVSADGADLLDGEDGNDYLRGYGGDDVLSGGAGDDQLLGDGDGSRPGETGADLLIGGTGNDRMDGGAGDDAYELNAGDGSDKIFDRAGTNTIVFGPGVGAGSITVQQGTDGSGTFLVLGYGAGDQVAVQDGFTGGVQFYRFADGTVLTPEELARRLPRTAYAPVTGTSAADTLTSNGLVESLSGGLGNDSYVFARANGRDLVTDNGGLDTLRFTGDVLETDVTFRRQSNGDLVLSVRDGGEIRVAGHYLDPASRVERVEFAGATTLDTSTLDDLPVAPIEGSAGADRLEGSASDDTLIGHGGQDTLLGGDGADAYVFRLGDGHDVVSDGGWNPAELDRLELRGFLREDVVLERSVSGTLTLASLVSDDSVTLPDFYSLAAHRIEAIDFFTAPDSTTPDLTLTSADLDALPTVPLAGTSGDDVLTGSVAADTLYGAGGNDALSGLEADDVLLGEDGDDVLAGGPGEDVLEGGAGVDTYLLEQGSQDIVFETGAEASRIRLDSRLDLSWVFWEADGEDLVVRTASGSSGLRLIGQASRIADWTVEDSADATVALSALSPAGSPLAVEMAARAENFLAGHSPDATSRPFRAPGRYEYNIDGVTVAYSHQESRSEFDFGPDGPSYSQLEQNYTWHDVVDADYSQWGAIGRRIEHVQVSTQYSDEALIVSSAQSESNVSRNTNHVLATLDLTAPTYNVYSSDSSLVSPIYDAAGEVIGYRTEITRYESWRQDTHPLAVVVPGPEWTAPFGEIHGGRALLSQETVESTLTQAHRIVAGDSANTIHSAAAVPTWIDAGGGDDTVYGASVGRFYWPDERRMAVLYGGAGDDALYGEGSILLGGHGEDLLSGGFGPDWIEVTRFETGVKRVEDRAGLSAEDYAQQFAEGYIDEVTGEWVLYAPAPGTAANDHAGLRGHAESADWWETGGYFKDTLVLGWSRDEVRLARAGDELLIYAPPGSEDPTAGTVLLAPEPRVRIALPAADGLFGSGIEFVTFAEGNPVYIGDLLSEIPKEVAGTAGPDVLEGSDGPDRIIAGAGNDLLLGRGGDDELLGGAGRNLLDGGAGADLLDATEGAGFLIGGAGDNVFQLGSAPAIVLVNPHTAYDTDQIALGSGALTVSFGGGFAPGDVYAYRGDDHDLWVWGYTPGDAWADVLIAGYFDRTPEDRPALAVQVVDAAGSTLYDLTGIVADFESDYQANGWAEVSVDATDPGRMLGAKDGAAWIGGWLATQYAVNGTIEGLAVADVQAVLGGAGFGQAGYYGTPGNDVLTAAATDDFVEGYGGDDVLIGGAGDDRLAGGLGADLLQGGEGSDTYEYARDGGSDRIEDLDPTGVDADSVYLIGIAPADVTATLDNGDLRLAFAGSSDVLSIHWDPAAGYAIEAVGFEDGTVWGRAALEARIVGATNSPPVVSASDRTVLLNDAVAAAGLFSVSDPEGDTIAQYEFWDDGAGGGHFEKSGLAQPANQAIAVDAAELADVDYVGGSAIGSERVWVRASDGEAWSPWVSWTMTSSPYLTNAAPAVSAADATVLTGTSVTAASLFSVTDADGDAPAQYEFWDDVAGGGHFAKSGAQQAAGQAIPVAAADLAALEYVAGSSVGAERVWVRAFDGLAWSAWTSWTMTSARNLTNAAPSASAADSTVLLNQAVTASALFGVSDPDGDPITQYEFWDDGAGGGAFVKAGVVQGTNPIPVSAAELADLQYVGGSAIGAERVWVRASDGLLWSPWVSWTMTSSPHLTNAAPTITAAEGHVGLGQAVAAATVFAATDADGDAIVRYELWDDGSGGGQFTKGGLQQPSGQAIPVMAAELADVQYVGAALNGAETVWARAYDGLAWGAWTSWRMVSANHAVNAAPVALADDTTVLLNQSVVASSLFSVSDADGDAISAYELWDDGAGGGYFAKGGVAQASGQAIAASAAELASVTYTGAASMASERLWVRASDGLDWGAWKAWNVQSAAHIGNVAPTVSAANTAILLNEPVLASTLFTAADADGDPIAAYEFWDDGAGGGAFFKGGIAQAAGQAIPVSAADLASVQYVGAAAGSSEQVWVRASDGLAWSNWKNWTITSSPHLTNAAPTVAASTAGALIGESVQASGLFTVNDADGDSMTQYEFWDDVAGGGTFAKGGVAQAAGAAIPVSAADLANLTYVGGATAGTEQVWARAYDGQAWSGWKNWNMVTLAGMVRGGAGADTLNGQSGATVLEGQAGADTLADADGNNLFHGGAGDDAMAGGAGSDLFAGGEGDDLIQTGTGSNVIAYNAGDGVDTVQSAAGAQNALSLGGGIRYSDLSLAKDGNDLVLNAGATDRIVLKDWYAGTGQNNVLNLQIVLDASADFDANSSDPLLNKRVQQFDFAGLVQQFDAALAASPGLTSWAITNALLAFHLSGADDAALGGDLAYQYGSRDAFTGIGLTAALDVLSSANFGAQAQALRPFSGLQEGLVKLG